MGQTAYVETMTKRTRKTRTGRGTSALSEGMRTFLAQPFMQDTPRARMWLWLRLGDIPASPDQDAATATAT